MGLTEERQLFGSEAADMGQRWNHKLHLPALLSDGTAWSVPISKAFKTCLLPSFEDFSGNQTGLEALGRATNLLLMLFSPAGAEGQGSGFLGTGNKMEGDLGQAGHNCKEARRL